MSSTHTFNESTHTLNISDISPIIHNSQEHLIHTIKISPITLHSPKNININTYTYNNNNNNNTIFPDETLTFDF